ncbi:bifunctional diaminohydroxyphosphoribosylaminopyrimidine deaminase/5-amino-6-(5-phosphoribosylamino)uracil reductase RibD [Methylotenera mobilis]|nr:bifunctional diaminohydroxyphosphoribosylaminopyrimidine deaminase/5-amino-6-(5-phosphoribosylamino)uracil reductase RibD [Methylotenera mobilis]
MSNFSTTDYTYMNLALRLAAQGLYTTQPNPRVGCVIVRDHQIVGQGAHLKAGEPHAEVFALRQAGELAHDADIYVTLEPCSHFGKTPPCVQAVIAAKPKRVIIAMQDPNPLVAGRGVDALRAQGIEVVVGLLGQEASALNAGFVSRMIHGMPYVRSKIAASLDGRTALNNGKSQWITGEAARQDVQHWRAQSCAILTGIGTVLADNPSMTVRLDPTTRQPLRVVVDSHLQMPLDCKMLEPSLLAASPVFIAYAEDTQQRSAALINQGAELICLPNDECRIDLQKLLLELAQRGVNEVLVEAGQGLNGALLNADLIDEFVFYYAPKLMGSTAHGMFAMPEFTAMQQVPDLQVLDVRQVGTDIRVRAKPIVNTA